jgi:hypothetical protein
MVQPAPNRPADSTAARVRAGQLHLRPFGTHFDDLEVDFTARSPVVITDLLTRCAGPEADPEQLWDLPVGKRIRCLLILAALSGVEEFEAGIDCPRCGVAVEVTLTFSELLEASRPHQADEVDVAGSGRYRLPTGRDQLGWLDHAGEDEGDMVNRILASLHLEGAAPAAMVEAALDEADPLVRTSVTAVCTDCRHEAELEMDVAGQALRSLQRQQAGMLEGVHLLASRYHWTEAEIFALPAWRRDHYLELLSRETL